MEKIYCFSLEMSVECNNILACLKTLFNLPYHTSKSSCRSCKLLQSKNKSYSKIKSKMKRESGDQRDGYSGMVAAFTAVSCSSRFLCAVKLRAEQNT